MKNEGSGADNRSLIARWDSPAKYGEGPPPQGGVLVGCHNENGLRSNNRWMDCIIEFTNSPYHVLLLQETHLSQQDCVKAENMCRARGIASVFTHRADDAPREGTAIMVKCRRLGLSADDITFASACDSKACTASFVHEGKPEHICCVYLPSTVPETSAVLQYVK